MTVYSDPAGHKTSDISSVEPPRDQGLSDLTTHVQRMRQEMLKQMDWLEDLIKQQHARQTGHDNQVRESIAPKTDLVDKTSAAVDLDEKDNGDHLNADQFLNQDGSSNENNQTSSTTGSTKTSTHLSEIDDTGELSSRVGGYESEVIKEAQSTWRDFARHPYFRGVVMVAVCANAMALGLSLELTGPTWDSLWDVIGHIFTAFFAFEMIIKLSCFGFKSYFLRGEAMWNILDFVCAWIGIVDSWFVPVVTGKSERSGAPVFRLLRVVRLAKLVHANKNLAVLAEGMIASLKSLIWVAVLLVVVLYAFAVGLIMNGIGENTSTGSHWNPQYFGSLFRAMVSLFGVCIGAEWTSIIWPVIEDGQPGTMLVFVIFIFIAQFGFLNIIVGVIVDRTNAAALKQQEEEAKEEIHQKMSVVKALGAKMDMYDKNNSGGLTFEEFTALLLAPENQELRSIVKQDLPIGFRARDLHSILEDDMDGNLTRQEFEEGIQRLISVTPFQERLLNQHRQAVMINEVKSQSQNLRMEIRGLLAEIKGQNGRGELLPVSL